jgi:hypothetical protein
MSKTDMIVDRVHCDRDIRDIPDISWVQRSARVGITELVR